MRRVRQRTAVDDFDDQPLQLLPLAPEPVALPTSVPPPPEATEADTTPLDFEPTLAQMEATLATPAEVAPRADPPMASEGYTADEVIHEVSLDGSSNSGEPVKDEPFPEPSSELPQELPSSSASAPPLDI